MSPAARANRGIKVLGVSLALLNGVLWFCTPVIRSAVVEARAANLPTQYRPQIVNGVQELLVYFDPWLARGVFPAVFIFGFAVIPFLRRPGPGWAFPVLVGGLLLAFEAVWLFLTAVGVFLRGPNWKLFWPDEDWDPFRYVPLNNVNLSDYFWVGWLGQSVWEMPWALRELLGLLLLGGYFLVGAIIARALFRASQRTTPCWRWVVLVIIMQVAALVPFKMLGRWVFNLKYWIFIPEYHLNV
jgi:hypothetical protein